jgi:hypothetical protein
MPDRLEQLVNEFVDNLREVIREQARVALEGSFASRRANKPVAATPKARRSKGEKRSGDELEALQEKFHAFVAKNPGLRIEQVHAQLGTTTKDLALPIRKLISEGRLKTKGQKRSTVYFAAGRRKKK